MNFQALCDKHRQNLKKLFENIDFMCATSDIWSKSNVSFIAVSVHFFNLKTLELQTRFIACSNFPGSHTADKISQKLKSIFDEYGILEKVAYITTDSAANYLASLKYHGDNYDKHRKETTWLEIDQDDFECVDEDEGEEKESEHEPVPNDVVDGDDFDDSNDFVSQFIDVDSVPLLGSMNHVKCGSHLVDKLASVDALKAREICSVFADEYDRIHNKMVKLWKIKDSRQQNEYFVEVTGKTVIPPHRIRWLGTHDAVSVLKVPFSVLLFRFSEYFNKFRFLLSFPSMNAFCRSTVKSWPKHVWYYG